MGGEVSGKWGAFLRGCVGMGFHPHPDLPPSRGKELDSRFRGNCGWSSKTTYET